MTTFADACTRSLARVRQAELWVKQQAANSTPSVPVANAGPQQTSLGVAGQSRTARRGYSLFRNWIYVCVNAVARRVAAQPWAVCKAKVNTSNSEGDVGYETNKIALKRYAQYGLISKAMAESSTQVLTDHPLVDVFDAPNPVQGRWEFLYISACNLLLTGACYWIADKNKDRFMLWAVPTDWITPKHEDGLFTSYELAIGASEKIELPPEMVFRSYIPDPSNLRRCLSPLEAIAQTASIDQSILDSQQQSFASIYPNVVITVGRIRGADGSLTDRRPVLKGSQRRQIIGAIRELWNQTVNNGEPAILDGLIESIHPLNSSPKEMDWQQSAESIKRRIMQAYGVNPITVGETQNANRAQAVEAEKQTASAIVNPIIRAMTGMATEVAKRWFDSSLAVVLEPSEPIDPDLQLRRWTAARRQGDVTRNEFRAEILGLPPIVSEKSRTPLLDTVGGMAGAVNILNSVGQGLIQAEQAALLLQLFFGLGKEEALAIAGAAQSSNVDLAPADESDENQDSSNDEGDDGGEQDGEPPSLPEVRSKANPNHDDLGRFASRPGRRTRKQKAKPKTKSEIAKASAKRVDREIQRYAEENNEAELAKKLGGEHLGDCEPVDVVVHMEGEVHGIELKTVVDNGNNKITMKRDAIERKRKWEVTKRGKVHTIVFDDSEVKDANGPGKHDKRKRKIYYRRGYGAFRLHKMYRVSSYAELKRLMKMDDDELPPGAGP